MNDNKYLEEIGKKIFAEKLRDEIKNVANMATSPQARKEFNDEMVRKTWIYQKKFGFETSPREGHEFWNNEADAFKHAFGSADMYFNEGNWGSILGGIYHENETPNNPQEEWNMDSWNNAQGREIAKEIEKEYGKDFYNFPQQTKDDIIAGKVMGRMRSGQLITNPNDSRKFDGKLEKTARQIKELQEGKQTGYASPINHIFTPEEIGKMTPEQFTQNEALIMEQLRNGQMQKQVSKIDYENYKNAESGNNQIFTREDISNMTAKEYSENEKEIMSQMNSIGIPYKKDLPSNVKTYENKKSYSTSSSNADGKWVTINGNHVLMKD